MVDRGWALVDPAQSDRYAARQAAARAAGAGAWQGVFVEPWVYRADMLAIEDRYVTRIAAGMLAGANAVMADERGGIAVFEGFGVNQGVAGAEQEVRVAFPATGYLLDGMAAGETFSWLLVARLMERWRATAQGRLLEVLRNAQWLELGGRPQTTLDVGNADQFYAAIGRQAAGWIAAGRQPLLFVPTTDNPTWIATWFGGSPPEGAVITRKTGIASPNYFGTIDGIDVYAGVPVAGLVDETPHQALLLPGDLLQQVTYGTAAGGGLVALDRDTTNEPRVMARRCHGSAALPLRRTCALL
jgi:hypothetical protein